MKVLVTGANGFTGRYLCAHLTAQGHQPIPLGVNLLNREALIKEVVDCAPDAIVHLAAISFVPNSTGEAVYATNVIGTENLLQAALACDVKPERVILASSSHVYGQNPTPKETDCPAPINHYGISKLAMEHLAHTYSDRLHIVITRPFTYTGVGQPNHYLLPKLVRHFRDRSPTIELGNIALLRDFSDVRWIAQAYEALLTQPLMHSTYNLCSGVSESLEALIEYLSVVSKHQIRVIQNPAFMRSQDILNQKGCCERLVTEVNLPVPTPIQQTLDWMLWTTEA
jgi:nucleoside-diphosphate-sugar epimerase